MPGTGRLLMSTFYNPVNEVLWAKRTKYRGAEGYFAIWKVARRPPEGGQKAPEGEAGEICDERMMMDRHAFERARATDFDTRGRDSAIIAAFVIRSSYADRAIVAHTGFLNKLRKTCLPSTRSTYLQVRDARRTGRELA
jgi:hypothetical protein